MEGAAASSRLPSSLVWRAHAGECAEEAKGEKEEEGAGRLACRWKLQHSSQKLMPRRIIFMLVNEVRWPPPRSARSAGTAAAGGRRGRSVGGREGGSHPNNLKRQRQTGRNTTAALSDGAVNWGI